MVPLLLGSHLFALTYACICLALSLKLAFSILHGYVISIDFANTSAKSWNAIMLINQSDFTILTNERKSLKSTIFLPFHLAMDALAFG